MFGSVRNWKQASKFAASFACIAVLTCPNVSFAAGVDKRPVELDAQPSALSLESKHAKANIATEVRNSKASSANAQVKSETSRIPSSKITKATSSTSKPTATTGSASTKLEEPSSSSSKTTAATTHSKSTSEDSKQLDKTKTASGKPPRKAHRQKVMLVPPPPPTTPTFLNTTSTMPGSYDLGLSVNFMSLDDLKFQQKTLEKKLEATKLDDKDEKRSTDEKRDRAKRFVELYEEGVVSRRELETAQQESERAIRDAEQSHIKVSEIDRVLSQVKERIQSMEAAKRPFKVSSKKSKIR
jgi:hypothetical protein